MKTAYIHIGTNKTGTSSLQYFFYHNSDWLKKKGFYYNKEETSYFAHHKFALSKASNDELKYQEKISDYASWLKTFILEYQDYDNAIFSSEVFHTLEDLSNVKDFFETYFDKVVVICYVRNFVEYLSSWYAQDVQGVDETRKFSSYIETQKLSYTSFINNWSNCFGLSNFILK